MRHPLKNINSQIRILVLTLFIIFLTFVNVQKLSAEAFQRNSYIISMGEIPQTYNNGLKPYGLLFDLVIKDEIPVYWIIKPGKQLYAEDFNTTVQDINGNIKIKSYSAGSFVIPAVYVNATVLNDIAYWQNLGVVVDKAKVDFDAPAFNYISSFPNAIIDQQNVKLVTNMFYNYTHDGTHGIPSTYYTTGTPNNITSCSDVYALPHADPQKWDQATIDVYKSFINNAKGFLWQGCHSVGAVEGHPNPGVANYLNLNILTTNGQIAFKKDPDYAFNNKNSPPFLLEMTAGDNPIMQIAATVGSAQTDGSQRVYIPRPDSAWRSTTTVAVWDDDNVNLSLNGNNPNKAAIIAFGRAYGDPTKGVVVQQASHTNRKGSESDNVSAARFYGNLLLQASIEKRPSITIGASSSLSYGLSYDMNASFVGGTPPYDVNWSMSCNGITDPGTFDFPNQNDVNFSQVVFTPNNYSFNGCILRVKVTDSCNRKNIETKIMAVSGYNPPLGYANITHANENFSTTGGLDVLDTKNPVNSLYTQISGQPFDITYVSLDSDKQTPTTIKGNIILELINPDGVTELDPSSCTKATAYADLTDQIALDAVTNAHFPGGGANTLSITGISYPHALKDAAFRVRYYPILAQTGDQYTYGIPNSEISNIQTAYPMCSASCGAIITDWSCYKCIAVEYGDAHCSRDNFSIRPAAFSLDLNESAPLIGGRKYTLDINASPYSGTAADTGYTETINQTADKNVSTELVVPAGCSLTSTTTVMSNDLNFTSGIGTSTQYFYNNVGNVKISANDANWTLVDIGKDDNGTIYSDCIEDSATNTPDANGKIGCNINGFKIFSFVPLAFRNELYIQDKHTGKFTYIANQNSNHGAKLTFFYTAVIDDNTPNNIWDNNIATNYIGNCFAKDTNSTITLINNKTLGWSDTQTRIWMYDTNSTTYQNTLPISFTNSASLFLASTPGKSSPVILVNFDRNASKMDNPFQLSKNDFNVTIAELNTSTPVSGSDFNRTNNASTTFIYARTHASRQRYEGNTGSANIYVEEFCYGNDCNATLLNSFSSHRKRIDDIRWFVNEEHNSSLDGTPGTVTEYNGLTKVTAGAVNITPNPNTVSLTYHGTTFPYKTTMENNASAWLIYNKDNATATKNQFSVEFEKAGTAWSGEHETTTTTETKSAIRTNRRTMW